jgi:3-hydroxy-9,10-secoandrosta-1,3,5(10)-triene-9,17-dione monooxygenase reductase component
MNGSHRSHGSPHGSEVPEGMKADARETWPSSELIYSWLADSAYDLQLHPGEDLEVDTASPEAVAEARRFRDVLGRFASGITVVTTMSNDEPVGLTCQSFSSVSLNPPLVLFVPARSSRAWPRIQRAGKFCVNFLAAGQADLSNTMASRGADKFADVTWTPSPVTGSPVLDDTLGYVDCTIHAVHEAGDHFVVIGRVQELVVGPGEEPLLFYQGSYRTTDG